MRKNLYLLLTSLLLVSLHAAATPASLSIENFNIRGGQTKTMLIDLNNPSDQITLVQFDMQLPEGLSIATADGDFAVDIAGRTTQKKHSLECKAVDSGYRFLMYSSSNTVFSGTSGAIISVTLKAASSFNGGDIRMEDILLVTPEGGETKPEPYIYTIEGVTFVTGITISPATAEVEQRKTVQLSATVVPDNATDKSVKWSSANTSIATVDNNGLVTGVGLGSTTITCTANDGSGVNGTCNVTVTASTDAPKLELVSIGVAGDGIAGTSHTVTYSVKNTGGDFNGTLYVFAKGSKESQPKQIFSGNTTIAYGQTVGNASAPLNYIFTAADTYRIWVATDAAGSTSLGETSIAITAAATLTAKSYTRKYGDDNPVFEFTADKGGFSGTPKITCEATKTSPVGTYPIVITQGTVDNNYVTYQNGTLTIVKAPLTVTAQSCMMRQETALPTFTAEYSGFKNNDTQSVLTTQPKFSTTATVSSPMGDYPITVSGVTAQNYEPQYVSGTLTIAGQPGDVNRDGEINTTDMADVVLYLLGKPNGIPTLFDADLNNDQQITTADVSQIINYVMTDNRYALADKLHVESTEVMAGADCNLNVVLTSADMSQYTAFQFDIVLPQGTTLKKEGVKLQASHFSDAQPSTDIRQMPGGEWRMSVYSNTDKTMKGQTGAIVTLPVAVAQNTAEGTLTGNIQNIVFTKLMSDGKAKTVRMDGSSFNISLQKEVTPTPALAFDPVDKNYGDAPFTITPKTHDSEAPITYTSNNTAVVKVNGSTFTIVGAGTATITATQAATANYTATSTTFTVAVAKAPLSISAGSYVINEGSSMPQWKAEYSGFVNGETEAVLTRLPVFSCTANENSEPGTYDVIISGAEAQNYNISYKQGTLTIVAVDQIIVTARNYTRRYGEANPDFEYDVTGGTLDGTPEIVCEAKTDSPVGSYPIIVRKGSILNQNVEFVNGTLTVTKAEQTLSWEQDLTNLQVYDQVELTATATSGLPVTYTMEDNDVCEIYTAGSKTYISCLKPGTVRIQAVQEGNGNYESTARIYQEVKVTTPDNEKPTLTIKQVSSGTLATKVNKGETFSLRIIPETGWYIHSLTFNGEDYTSQIDESGMFVTPEINSDAIITIAYAQGEEGIASTKMEKARVLGTPNGIRFSHISKGEEIAIYDLGGRQLFHSNTVEGETQVSLPTDAVYLVKIGTQTIKIGL